MLAKWLILLLLLQISVLPIIRKYFPEHAIPLSFPVSLLLATLISWYLALFHIPVLLMLVPFILLLGYCTCKRSISLQDLIQGKIWYIIFLGTFILTLMAKLWYDPSIDISYEKFMDSMILSSMMNAPQIPPVDGWYAGGTLTWYYYLGAWMFAIPGVILGIPASVTYNLAIPTVFAMSAVMIYSCSSLLMDRYKFLPLALLVISYPGFFSLIPIAISDNTPFRFILDGSVRMILSGAVTENPLSALLIGSPRPYAVAMMIQCLIIFLLIYGFKSWRILGELSRVAIGLLLALCLGTLIPLHSWDVIIYLPLSVFVGFLISYQQYLHDSESFNARLKTWIFHLVSSLKNLTIGKDDSASAFFFISLLAPIASLLVYLPFLFQLNNQRMQGISFLPTPSDPIQLLLVHGFFILILLVYLRHDIIRKPLLLVIPLIVALAGFIGAAIVIIPAIFLISRRFEKIEELLAFTGIACIVFCEFFALVQNGSPDRLNTTYKFYFASWVLLGISTFTMLGKMIEICPIIHTDIQHKIVSALLIIGILLFPVILLSSGPLWTPTLDGTEFVSKYIGQEEANALDYLRSLPQGEILIEGVVPSAYDQDDAAKYFSRVSAFTGVSSVMGSYSREKVYRGPEITNSRGEDSVLVYLQPERAKELMKKYNATLLYVGIPEITLYNLKNPGIYASYGFTPVFHENQTTIWRIPSA